MLVSEGAPSAGADAWGAFQSTTLSWALNTAPTTPFFTTTFVVYVDAPGVGFEATFLTFFETGSNESMSDLLVADFPVGQTADGAAGGGGGAHLFNQFLLY